MFAHGEFEPMKFMTIKFRSLLVVVFAVLAILAGPILVGQGSAWAQDGVGGERAPDEQTEQAERPTVGESSLASQERTLPGGMLALVAYLVLWGLIFGLVWMSLRRQGKLNAEIAALERRMDQVFEDFD